MTIIDKNNPDLKTDQTIHGFRVEKITHLPVLKNIMYQLVHESTGAKMIHLSNEDDNNCFGVAFKTTPKDSTGIAHILEHTALCGSKNFPVRDPFFSMIKRSMKTFMNAFTASDWTMYPFSTQNQKDFFNLMKVYLDAAFFPELSETNFKQEGHRLEFSEQESADSPLTIQGVVYNEMKGAMSSQSQIMHDVTGRSLFPTITYKYNSGGDPEEIIKLTHQQLVEFHQTHYHPSNAYFYTYGDLPLLENLKFIDEFTLSKFERINTETDVPLEKRYDQPKEFSYCYPLNESDNDGKRCQIALSWLTCANDNPIDILSLQLINLILLGHSGAPLRKALIESGLGKSMADTTGFEDEIRESYFSVGLQAVAENDVDKVESLILSTLQEIYEKGITQQQIDSAIHQIEFDTREISGGHYPYSLNLLFRFFGTWIHGGDPVSAIDFDETLAKLKTNLKEGSFLENQIKKYLLDNPHRVKVVLKPDATLEKTRSDQLEELLAKRKEELSEEEKKKIVQDALDLKAFQEAKEDLSCLPTLKVSDIPKEIRFVDPVKKGFKDHNITFYDRPTNGIIYLNWYFNMVDLADEDRVWLPLLSNLMMNTGAGDFSYEEMAEQLSQFTGGFSAAPNIERQFNGKDALHEFFVVSSKSLNPNFPKLIELSNLVLGPRAFNEFDRIQTLIAQRTNNLLNSVVQAGHNYAANLANRCHSRVSFVEEIYSGIHQIQNMRGLLELDQPAIKNIINYLKYLLTKILTSQKPSMLVIGDESTLKDAEPHLEQFLSQYYEGVAEIEKIERVDTPKSILPEISSDSNPEAWCTTTPISYVAKAFKTIDFMHEKSSKLFVFSNLLKACFLHGEIREKGGAYGAMTSYNVDEGIFNMLSYRDPNLVKTTEIYKEALKWIESGDFSQEEVDEAILQSCSSMDTPVSPAGKAVIEYGHARKGKTKELRERFRAGVLSTTKDELLSIGRDYLSAETAIAAVTSSAIVERDKDAYKDTKFKTFNI